MLISHSVLSVCVCFFFRFALLFYQKLALTSFRLLNRSGKKNSLNSSFNSAHFFLLILCRFQFRCGWHVEEHFVFNFSADPGCNPFLHKWTEQTYLSGWFSRIRSLVYAKFICFEIWHRANRFNGKGFTICFLLFYSFWKIDAGCLREQMHPMSILYFSPFFAQMSNALVQDVCFGWLWLYDATDPNTRKQMQKISKPSAFK